jgi:hypothetical protein
MVMMNNNKWMNQKGIKGLKSLLVPGLMAFKGQKYLLVLCLMSLFLPASAQEFTPEKSVVDVEKVAFKQPVTVRFKLWNKGNKPLQIADVRTNCGCTVVSYPRKPVQAGHACNVMATYDAKQMGHFEKTLGVYVQGNDKPLMLRLKGIVVEKVDKPAVIPAKNLPNQDKNSKKKKKKDKKKQKEDKKRQKEEKKRQKEKEKKNEKLQRDQMKPSAIQQKREREK